MISVSLFDLVADLTELKDYVGDSIQVTIDPYRMIFANIPSSCDEDKLEEIMEDSLAIPNDNYEICKKINGSWSIEIDI